MNEHRTQALLHSVRDDIPVGPPPIAEVMAAGTRRRRERRAGWVAAGLGMALLAAGTSYVAERELGRSADVAANPVNIPWWGANVLHLESADVPVASLDMLVQVQNGVVYWAEGRGSAPAPVVFVDDDGNATTIGHKAWHSPIAAEPNTGWVAWVEDTHTTPPILRVYDTDAGEEVAQRTLDERGPRWERLDEGSHPIAIDGGRVFYAAQDGDYEWEISTGTDPQKVTDAGTHLLDHQSGIQAHVSWDPTQGYGNVVIRHPGARSVRLVDGYPRLSPDGRYAFFLLGPNQRPALYETESGNVIETGLRDRRPVTEAAFGPDGTITYVLGTTQAPPDDPIDGTFLPLAGPPWDLVTCEIDTATCETVAHQAAEQAAILAE